MGHGSIGVAVFRLGMQHRQLTGTGLPSTTLRDGWRCGQRDGSPSRMLVAWAATWISLSLASHCLCLTFLFSFLFFLHFSLVPFGFGLLGFLFLFSFFFFLDLHGLLARIGWFVKIRGTQVVLIKGAQVFFFFFFLKILPTKIFFFFWAQGRLRLA